MLLPVSHFRHVRTGLRAGVVLTGLSIFADAGRGQSPAPTAPTVTPRATAHVYGVPKGTLISADVLSPAPNGTAPAVGEIPELTLGECLAVAIDRQPSLKAVQASQQATRTGLQALNNIGRIGELIRPDLPIRKQQACRGVTAAAADVQKIHNEVVYDVTRLYYTVVYTRQQEQVANEVVQNLEALVKVAEEILKSPMPGEMNALKLAAMKIGMAEARQARLTAQNGQRQALAALREAMAVEESTFPFKVKDAELPLMGPAATLTKEEVVAQALGRRPELSLAAAGVDAFRLEVYAQAKVRGKRAVPTFGSGSDLHAHPVPQSVRDKDYRPGAIEPEMPNQLVGDSVERQNRANWYRMRAESVFEKARNLVNLEAENAFNSADYAAAKLVEAKFKFDQGTNLADLTRQTAENIKAKDQILQNEVIAARAKSDYIEAAYQHLLALAALERVTAGGVKPAFPGR